MQDKHELAKPKLSERLRLIGKRLGECGHLMVGVPDYETYVAHVARAHPGQAPMTYKEFFRERQEARYAVSKGRFRGCC